MINTKARTITVAVPTKKEAHVIAMTLLRKKVVACAQIIGPVSSHFRWEDRVTSAKEFILICKTTIKMTPRVVRLIEALHSYECPVIEVTSCTLTGKKANVWLNESVL